MKEVVEVRTFKHWSCIAWRKWRRRRRRRRSNLYCALSKWKLIRKAFQSICKLFLCMELLHQKTMSGFMTALLARNVVRPCIIQERSVPIVLQIKPRDLLHSPTSSVGTEMVTGLSVGTYVRAYVYSTTRRELACHWYSAVSGTARFLAPESSYHNDRIYHKLRIKKKRLSFPEFAFNCFNGL